MEDDSDEDEDNDEELEGEIDSERLLVPVGETEEVVDLVRVCVFETVVDKVPVFV